jgi:hypothetical protein
LNRLRSQYNQIQLKLGNVSHAHSRLTSEVVEQGGRFDSITTTTQQTFDALQSQAQVTVADAVSRLSRELLAENDQQNKTFSACHGQVSEVRDWLQTALSRLSVQVSDLSRRLESSIAVWKSATQTNLETIQRVVDEGLVRLNEYLDAAIGLTEAKFGDIQRETIEALVTSREIVKQSQQVFDSVIGAEFQARKTNAAAILAKFGSFAAFVRRELELQAQAAEDAAEQLRDESFGSANQQLNPLACEVRFFVDQIPFIDRAEQAVEVAEDSLGKLQFQFAQTMSRQRRDFSQSFTQLDLIRNHITVGVNLALERITAIDEFRNNNQLARPADVQKTAGIVADDAESRVAGIETSIASVLANLAALSYPHQPMAVIPQPPPAPVIPEQSGPSPAQPAPVPLTPEEARPSLIAEQGILSYVIPGHPSAAAEQAKPRPVIPDQPRRSAVHPEHPQRAPSGNGLRGLSELRAIPETSTDSLSVSDDQLGQPEKCDEVISPRADEPLNLAAMEGDPSLTTLLKAGDKSAPTASPLISSDQCIRPEGEEEEEEESYGAEETIYITSFGSKVVQDESPEEDELRISFLLNPQDFRVQIDAPPQRTDAADEVSSENDKESPVGEEEESPERNTLNGILGEPIDEEEGEEDNEPSSKIPSILGDSPGRDELVASALAPAPLAEDAAPGSEEVGDKLAAVLGDAFRPVGAASGQAPDTPGDIMKEPFGDDVTTEEGANDGDSIRAGDECVAPAPLGDFVQGASHSDEEEGGKESEDMAGGIPDVIGAGLGSEHPRDDAEIQPEEEEEKDAKEPDEEVLVPQLPNIMQGRLGSTKSNKAEEERGGERRVGPLGDMAEGIQGEDKPDEVNEKHGEESGDGAEEEELKGEETGFPPLPDVVKAGHEEGQADARAEDDPERQPE